MKNSWKLFLIIMLTAVVSALVSVGVYGYLNKNGVPHTATGGFLQPLVQTSYAAAAENTDFTLSAERSVHAVVHIKSVVQQKSNAYGGPQYFDPFEFFFGQGQRPRQYQQQPRIGFGSGVIISTDGYIVTNNHVIDGADEIEVTTNDNKTYNAKLIGADEATDLALLKIDQTGLEVIPFGDSDKLKVGEWVLAVGNPFNLTSTVTAGIVSAKNRGGTSFAMRGGQEMKISSYIQTDAAVNPGNSGGALINTKGELVGINTMILSETGNFAGYSFAIPVSIVAKVTTDLKAYGAVQRAVLGIFIDDIPNLKRVKPEEAAKLKVTEGAYVTEFQASSAARDAGIEVGDVIIAVNDVTVRSVSELQEQVSRYNPGTKVKIKVQRGSAEKTFEVELKNMQGGTDIVKNVSGQDLLGGAFQKLSDEKKKKYGVSYGIEVTGVASGKLKNAGIAKGFIILIVNDRRVDSVETFEKVVDQTMQQNPDDRGLFIKGIYPNGKMKYYAIDLNE